MRKLFLAVLILAVGLLMALPAVAQDELIFGMVLPNIIGVVLLSGKVKAAYSEYMGRLAAGEYKTFK